AQLVNPVADGLDGLRHRLVLEFGEGLRLHGKVPGISRSPIDAVLGQVVLHDAQQIGAGTGLHTFQNDVIRIVLRIRLSDIGVVDLVAAHLLLQNFDRVLRIHIDGVVHLNLENQVSAAAQIETEMNALTHGRKQSLGREALGNSKDACQEEQQRTKDDAEFGEKSLVHKESVPSRESRASVRSRK